MKALVIIETLLDTLPGAPERAAIWAELDAATRYWNRGRSYPPAVRARLREVGLRDYPLQRPETSEVTTMGMRITRNVWLCQDCTLAAANDEYTDDDARNATIKRGLRALGPHLASNSTAGDDGYVEYARTTCDCCDSTLAGSRHRFAILRAVKGKP